MFRQTPPTLFRHLTFEGAKANRLGGRSPVFGAHKMVLASTAVPQRGAARGRGDRVWDRRPEHLGKEFGRDFLNKSVLPGAQSHEFLMKPRARDPKRGDLDRAIQHLIVSLQRQVDFYGRREVPQRIFQGECFLTPKPAGMRGEEESVPQMSWVEMYKKIDTGYVPADAAQIEPNREEVLYRIQKHFKRKRIELRLDQYTSSPPGFTCHLSWREEDDHRALTPEGADIPVPRVDLAQPIRFGRKGAGFGMHQGGM
eukprot:TRINITY_DN73908_c0_g1_i1.p2 TRINITY_DN73908_c0_g1~~TRINITY_DN73908_c0_g1_i1.p2  ORF type:complete len:255 (+),score=55.15 TRINITY_DN73908_c0_g1_i1:35-799(+)